MRERGGKWRKREEREKKIARIPQGFAVIPDGEIVRLPTESPAVAGAPMMTHLRRSPVGTQRPGWCLQAPHLFASATRPFARALYAKCRYAERQMAGGQACAAVCGRWLRLQAVNQSFNHTAAWRELEGMAACRRNDSFHATVVHCGQGCEVNGQVTTARKEKSKSIQIRSKKLHLFQNYENVCKIQ